MANDIWSPYLHAKKTNRFELHLGGAFRLHQVCKHHTQGVSHPGQHLFWLHRIGAQAMIVVVGTDRAIGEHTGFRDRDIASRENVGSLVKKNICIGSRSFQPRVGLFPLVLRGFYALITSSSTQPPSLGRTSAEPSINHQGHIRESVQDWPACRCKDALPLGARLGVRGRGEGG